MTLSSSMCGMRVYGTWLKPYTLVRSGLPAGLLLAAVPGRLSLFMRSCCLPAACRVSWCRRSMPAVKVLGSLARVLQAVGVPKAVGKAAVKCGRLTHGARVF